VNRRKIIGVLAAMLAASAQGARAQGQPVQMPLGLLGFRYVIPLEPWRIGVLDAAGVAVIERPGVAPVGLNLPRATPGIYRWVRTPPPATPYMSRAQTISDVIYSSVPDEITMAVGITPYAIFGVATPADDLPKQRMPSFLIRIIPSTLELETYALPPEFKGDPATAYRAGGRLIVVNDRGEPLNIPL
jgi:hypothetical protein